MVAHTNNYVFINQPGKMFKMNLSIIVPVYNMAKDNKLIHCLDSLINQNVSDYEIIAVNDASTDDSLNILKEYESRYPKVIKVISYDENLRQGGAKNKGLDMASGNWVGFIDSDDWASPFMFSKLLQRAEETGADFVGCDYTIVDHYTFEEGRTVINNTEDQTGTLDKELHKSHILRPGSMVVKIYKRSVIEDNKLRFPEHIFYEDNQAASLWSMYFTHFERVNEPLYYYLTVNDSTTHHVSWEKCQDRITAGKLLVEESKSRNLYDEYKEEIDYKFGELAYAGTLFSYMYSGKNRKLKHTKQLQLLIKEYVPDFVNQKYFKVCVMGENAKLVKLHLKSNFMFYWYYILLFTYRKIRSRK